MCPLPEQASSSAQTGDAAADEMKLTGTHHELLLLHGCRPSMVKGLCTSIMRSSGAFPVQVRQSCQFGPMQEHARLCCIEDELEVAPQLHHQGLVVCPRENTHKNADGE